ncbi:MAG: AAA family ATPase [Saprospiraceae bacterium]|nr:AAA family ATPase [Saprospiraceae bacterium]
MVEKINQPKIMYVPAERNFLSAISNINKVSDFIVGSLKNYSVEFRNAQLAYKDKEISLPINNTTVYYDPLVDENYISFEGKKLKLTEASSGFHSIVPLYWVSKYLVDFLKLGEKRLLDLLSPDQTVRRRNELTALNAEFIGEDAIREKEKRINAKYICNHFVNIVEEPEQNLFPTSQKSMLESLLKFNNENIDNKLIITTHSPYLINYLTLAVKAEMVEANLLNSKASLIKLSEIIPIDATLSGNDLVIYELEEKEGTIKALPNYKGLPSDENYLNSRLEDSNELFAQLQEIEKGWR